MLFFCNLLVFFCLLWTESHSVHIWRDFFFVREIVVQMLWRNSTCLTSESNLNGPVSLVCVEIQNRRQKLDTSLALGLSNFIISKSYNFPRIMKLFKKTLSRLSPNCFFCLARYNLMLCVWTKWEKCISKKCNDQHGKRPYLPSLFPTGLKPDVPFLAEAILFPRLATDRTMVENSWNPLNPVWDENGKK